MDVIKKAVRSVILLSGYMEYFFTDVVDRLTGEPTADPLTGPAFMMQQLRETFIMAACGACVAFMFQTYDACIKRWVCRDDTNSRMLTVRGAITFTDVIFCIIVGIVIARFWFRSSYGRLSIHEIFGVLAGFAVGMCTFAFGKSKRRHTIALIYVILIITAYFVIS